MTCCLVFSLVTAPQEKLDETIDCLKIAHTALVLNLLFTGQLVNGIDYPHPLLIIRLNSSWNILSHMVMSFSIDLHDISTSSC